MSDVIEEMSDEMPETFFWFDVLLAANMTIATDHCSAAIQAVLFLSFRGVAHTKFLLK